MYITDNASIDNFHMLISLKFLSIYYTVSSLKQNSIQPQML